MKSSSSSLINSDDQQSVSSSHSDSYEETDNLADNIVVDNAYISQLDQNSIQSDDNNQILNQGKIQKNRKQGKTNPILNKADSSKEGGARMIRSSRKIKKDYKNLSLASKYETEEQNDNQSLTSKKKKLTNQGMKQKKKKYENDSQIIQLREGVGYKNQYQQSRTSIQSQNQQIPHFKQFKNQIMQSISKYKNEIPSKMFSFLQKQQQINLNTLAKVSIHLPITEEYLDSIKNIQMVLADQEVIIKELVGASPNQSLFDFLTKQKHSKKSQSIQQQLLLKQKQEEALKDNIEQLKQNLQYKINPQFIKSELKKEKDRLMSTVETSKQSPSSSSKTGTSLSQQYQNNQNKDSNSEMDIENKQNFSTEQKFSNIDNQKIKIEAEKAKIKRESSAEKIQQDTTNQLSIKSEYVKNERDLQEGITSQNNSLQNSEYNKCSDETSKKIKTNSMNNKALKTSEVPQKIPTHPQMVPLHPQYKNYGNVHRHPLKQQALPSDNYYMHPHPYQQQPYPNHYRYLESTTKQNMKQENQQNTFQTPSSSSEPLTRGDNQENIYHNTPNHPYHPYPHPGYHQYHYHPAHPMNNPYPYDYHVVLRNDQHPFNSNMRRYIPNFSSHHSQNSSYPIHEYQNNLGTNITQDMNDQSYLSIENNNQSFGYSLENNLNEKDQKSRKPSTQKKDDFFNELDENYEDSLSNFNSKPFSKNKKQKQGAFENDLDMDFNDQYSQNLMDFS